MQKRGFLSINRALQIIAVGAGLLAWLPATAQTMIEASMSGQTQKYTKHGIVDACSFRIAGRAEPGGGNARRLFDVILTLNKVGAIVKLAGFELPRGKIGLENLAPLPNYGGWLKAQGKKAAAPISPLKDGKEPPNAKLFLADTDGAVEVFNAVANNAVVEVAIRWQPDIESIYFGRVSIKDTQVDQFYKCLDDLKMTLRARQ